MARVFLSYSREDTDRAKLLADALNDAGHEVWWDRRIHGGSRFATEIDRELKEAEAVVVLWSEAACQSAWVQDEAAEGRDTGRLVPVTLDETKPPLGFRQYQAIDLANWNGRCPPAQFESLLDAVAAIANEPAARPGEMHQEQSSPLARKLSICVLPFANMSGDLEQEYFSDGISEDIITDLSKISALSVLARNTAFTFKNKAVRVPDIVRELGVTHVLEGSVRRSGGRVRITAQLIDGAVGDHIWADRYDRDLTDIFEIQDEISRAIVAALKLKLLPQEKRAIENRGTNSAEAYDLYLMARQYWVSGNDGDSRRDEIILRLCRNAIEIDPNYAQAWALMAITQAWMHHRGNRQAETGVVAAERALELDPSLAEPHCVKASDLAQQGRFEEADAEIATAVRLDPDSWDVNKEAGFINYRQGRLNEAMAQFEKAALLMDTDYRSPGMMTSCARGLGDADKARRGAQMTVERAERALGEDRSNGAALGYGAMALGELGETERAKEWVRRALIVDPDNLILRFNLACLSTISLDDSDTALELIAPFMERCGRLQVTHVENDPDLEKLRKDDRFQAMITAAKDRLGLGTEQVSSATAE